MDPEEGTCAIDRDSRDSVRGEPLKVHANAHIGMQESHIPPIRYISTSMVSGVEEISTAIEVLYRNYHLVTYCGANLVPSRFSTK
jgi:hypothetical protein